MNFLTIFHYSMEKTCAPRELSNSKFFQDGMPTTLLFRCHPTHVLYNESFVSLLSASQLYKRGAMITPAHYVNGIYQRKGKLDDEAIKEAIKEISLKKRWAMQALFRALCSAQDISRL